MVVMNSRNIFSKGYASFLKNLKDHKKNNIIQLNQKLKKSYFSH